PPPRRPGAAGVDRVLVIGGGVSTPVGPFDRTMQVLETGLLQQHGVKTIGVAGHPEGSKDIPAEEIARSVAEKNAYARATGTDLYIATQFCFDAEAIIAWDRELRRAGNALPIHLGLAGPAKLKSLIHYAAMCGVGPSMRFLTRQAMNIAKLASVSVPDKLLTELADYRAKDPDCGIAQLHLFAFGGLERSARWVKAMQEGRFTLDGRGGFAMDEALD
uniref:metFprotein n=1 Tax=Inquilinus sp. OTU3971 TaxID=3043855 RepID=UPI00313E5F09